MAHDNHIAVLMGPTGSGKSALALELAGRVPAVIINADAMQLVDTLRVITARPTPQEEAVAEHALYGVVPATTPTSVALWLKLVEPAIRTAWAQGKLPVLVGGTGMYITGLMEGIAQIPPVPEEVRAPIRALDTQQLRVALEQKDPAMAARLKPGDTQRTSRALEVLEATGKSLAYWQELGNAKRFPEANFSSFYLDVSRETLYARINQRFGAMMENGALEEVKSLLSLDLSADNPITRAHGVPELAQYLAGEMTLEAAVSKAQQNTRNYAKRQMTWIRNQMPQARAVGSAAEITGSIA